MNATRVEKKGAQDQTVDVPFGTVAQDPVRVRTGLNKSVYLSKKADALVAEASFRFRRSDSAVLSILAERHLPRLLADKAARL